MTLSFNWMKNWHDKLFNCHMYTQCRLFITTSGTWAVKNLATLITISIAKQRRLQELQSLASSYCLGGAGGRVNCMGSRSRLRVSSVFAMSLHILLYACTLRRCLAALRCRERRNSRSDTSLKLYSYNETAMTINLCNNKLAFILCVMFVLYIVIQNCLRQTLSN